MSLTPLKFTKDIRRAVADYMQSEGCDCCRSTAKHEGAKARLANLLKIPKYKDGSGFDFGKYQTSK